MFVFERGVCVLAVLAWAVPCECVSVGKETGKEEKKSGKLIRILELKTNQCHLFVFQIYSSLNTPCLKYLQQITYQCSYQLKGIVQNENSVYPHVVPNP